MLRRFGHIPGPLYSLVRRLVPITCVDILPVRSGAAGLEVGLIRRVDEHGGESWAMVGGGVYGGETLEEAVDRHIRTTLGQAVRRAALDVHAPGAVGEYFPFRRNGSGFDPNKHAVALSYLVPIEGEVVAQGEATDFRWFPERALPDLAEIGFGHHLVIDRLLQAAR